MVSRFRFDRTKPIDLTCTQCGHKFPKTLGEMEADDRFACPACGVAYQPSNVSAEIQSAEKQVDKFRRNIGRMSRK